MSCVECSHHIHRLAAAHLTHNDPVRPHSERCADQFPDGNGMAAFHIFIAGFHADQVFNSPDLQLRAVLYRNDALVGRDERR